MEMTRPEAHHDTDARGSLERGRVQGLRAEGAQVLQRAVQLGVAGDAVAANVFQEHRPVHERVAGELRGEQALHVRLVT